MKKQGFDNDKYIKTQSEHIRKRIDRFGGKLYMEFGGKLFDDFHASRVLPGFEPDSKIRMLSELKEDVEIIVAINALDIEKNKMRADLGITYDMDVLRLIDAFRGYGFYVGSVVLTRFSQSEAVLMYLARLKSLGLKVYRHYTIQGYPSNIPLIVSEDGYGKNEYLETKRPLTVVTAPGPGSGKMAVCLSQLYQDHVHGIRSGYAKFETFPVWNLPLSHPVNLAYEAATADLNDVNMIDPFHLEAYGETTVNYNRDVEIFPVLNEIFKKIYSESPYKSPTDMGVNMAGNCIVDDSAVREAAKQEIIRRYYRERVQVCKGTGSPESVEKIELLMKKADVSEEDRKVAAAANIKAELTGAPAAAIELDDKTVVTGKTSFLMGATSAAILNSLKIMAGVDDKTDVIAESVIKPIHTLKVEHLGHHNPHMHINEMLIALTICAGHDENAARALAQLDRLRGCEVHSSVILSQEDENTLNRLGAHVTCEPKYQTAKLFHG